MSRKALPYLRPLPELVRNDSPFGDLYPFPIALWPRAARLPSGLRVAFLLHPVPCKHPVVSLIPQHLKNRQNTPRSQQPRPWWIWGRDTLGIQGLGDCSLADARRVHLEDSAYNDGLLLDDFEFHAADRKSSVLAVAGWIFNRHVAVSVALATRLEAIQSPSLCPRWTFSQRLTKNCSSIIPCSVSSGREVFSRQSNR